MTNLTPDEKREIAEAMKTRARELSNPEFVSGSFAQAKRDRAAAQDRVRLLASAAGKLGIPLKAR